MRKRRGCFLLLVLGWCLLSVPAHAWNTEVVDSLATGGWAGGYTSIARDSGGAIYISSYSFELEAVQVATNASGSWVTTVIAALNGEPGGTSIAVDGPGQDPIGLRRPGRALLCHRHLRFLGGDEH